VLARPPYAVVAVLWLAATLVLATQALIEHFPPPGAPLNSDAHWVYLPGGRALLDAPWTFLTTDPQSYHVAPLGYAWSAVWGAERARIEFANCILFLLCIVLMWRCALRLGGLWAAMLASALLAGSPMIGAIPQVLTEPLYLFGLMLCMFGGIEYALGSKRPRWVLAAFAAGLSITLLSRPILQFFALAALLATLALRAWSHWHARKANPAPARAAGVLQALARVVDRRWCAALLAALLLPAAVVLKNGVCFGVWALATGAGTGLYYGVNPLRQGLEPAYSGFSYDSSRTPSVALSAPNTPPLAREADRVNAQVALNIIGRTTLADNARFFAHKLKSWLLYSTPELHINPKLRRNRTRQWLLIGMAAAALAWRQLQGRRARAAHWHWPGGADGQCKKAAITLVLLLLVLAMAVQLAPVLYSGRYNLFAIEPWMLLLCAVAAAVLLQMPPKPAHVRGAGAALARWCVQQTALALAVRSGMPGAGHLQTPRKPAHAWAALRWHLKYLLQKSAIVAALLLAAPALTGRAIRHETFAIDPYRPGPVQVLLAPENLGAVRATHAAALGNGRWRLQANPATLSIPVQGVPAQDLASPADAVWRMRFAIALAADKTHTCRQAVMAVSHARHAHGVWHVPDGVLQLRPDGKPHTYAMHGNHALRPSRDSELSVTFFCPPGTVVTWLGADLLQPTLAEAARSLVENGTPIDPYYRRDPVP